MQHEMQHENKKPPRSRGFLHGSNGARTHDLSRVRRTLIPAELYFLNKEYYSTSSSKCNSRIQFIQHL